MRTALLSFQKRDATGALLGSAMLAGRSTLDWQADLVRELGCKRIICLVERADSEVLALQSKVERGGGEFHVVRGALQLIALLKTDDELVVVQDGVIVPPETVREATFEDGRLKRGVFAMPSTAEAAERFPETFERIDASRSWAGFSVMRASVAQKLGEWPTDGDPVSLLLRLSLQSGTGVNEIEWTEAVAAKWLHAADSAGLERRERALIREIDDGSRWSGPSTKAGSILLRAITPWGLMQGPLYSAFAAGLFAVLACILALYGFPAIVLALGVLGAFFGSLSMSWAVLKARLQAKQMSHQRSLLGGMAIDLFAMGLLLILVLPADAAGLVLPVLSIGLVRLAGTHLSPSVAPFWNDRALQLAGLAICAAYDALIAGLAVLGIVALGMLLSRILAERSPSVE